MMDYLKKFRLDCKIVAVTGGLGLLGKEVSIAMAQAGAKVLVLDINREKGLTFEKENKNKKLDIKFIEFDISDIKKLSENIKNLFSKYGKIDVWVNAAYPRTEDWKEDKEYTNEKSWIENVNIHLNSFCISTREIAELMKENKIRGSIINFGSIYGVVGPDFEIYVGTSMSNKAAYSAIKGGIINFSRYVASYYGKDGIRINALCPGGIFDNQNPVFVKNYEKRTPLRRMGKSEEIASAVLFLASEAASYITGTTFMVDGGWTCI